MLTYWQMDHRELILKLESKHKFSLKNFHQKIAFENVIHKISVIWFQELFHKCFIHHRLNLIDILLHYNSIPGYDISMFSFHYHYVYGSVKNQSAYKLLLSCMVVADVYRFFIPNKTTFTKCCLTQWIWKLPSFEVHQLWQCLANFTGLAGIVNATVYKIEPIFTGLRDGKLF